MVVCPVQVGGSDQDLQRLFGYNSGELTQIFEELDRSKGGKVHWTSWK